MTPITLGKTIRGLDLEHHREARFGEVRLSSGRHDAA